MEDKAKAAKAIFDTLAFIFDTLTITEIAISPYILPLPDEEADSALSTAPHADRSPQASTSSISADAADSRLSPQAIRPFSLFEHDKLVIPQKPLYAAFGYAVKALSHYPRSIFSTSATSNQQPSSMDDEDSARSASTINSITRCILIQCPEHVRALNLRKKILIQKLRHHTSDQASSSLSLIQAELDFTRLLLNIASNAKMGTLWHHRKWLLSLRKAHYKQEEPDTPLTAIQDQLQQQCKCRQMLLDSLHGKKIRRIYPIFLPSIEIEQELQLVSICVEQYPRNYQAWAYRSWLVKGQSDHTLETSQTQLETSSTSLSSSWSLESEYTNTERHLATHIADHTAANHLLSIIEIALDSQWHDTFGGSTISPQVKNFALDFLERYPHKETPWLLVRGITAVLKQKDEETTMFTESVLEFARGLLREKTTALDLKSQQETENEEQVDWQMKQDRLAVKYADRSIFYLSCQSDSIQTERPELGSPQAKLLLESMRGC